MDDESRVLLLKRQARAIYPSSLSAQLERVSKKTNIQYSKQSQVPSCPKCSVLYIPGTTCTVRQYPTSRPVNLKNKNKRARKRILLSSMGKRGDSGTNYIHYKCMADGQRLVLPTSTSSEVSQAPAPSSHTTIKANDQNKINKSKDSAKDIRNEKKENNQKLIGSLSLNDFLL